MQPVSINLPEECLKALKLPAEEIRPGWNRELAISICLYSKGLLSFGKARQLAGITRWAFHDVLGDEGIYRSRSSIVNSVSLNIFLKRPFPIS